MISHLLLFLSVLPVFHSDPVNVKFYLKCDSNSTISFWCGHLILYEEDTETNHDILQNFHFCSYTERHDMFLLPMDLGGDGSLQYEMGFHLTHNCTSNSILRCVKPKKLAHFGVLGEKNVTFAEFLFNEGERGECKHPNIEIDD